MEEYRQLDIFECFGNKYRIDKPIRLIELFAGVGSQLMSLRELENEGKCKVESYKMCEFDKYAVNSFNAIHDTDYLTSDVTELHAKDLEITDKLNYCYIMTYSFPCTDLSVAGKMQGMAEGSGTRSSLLWEVKRILEECKNCNDGLPQVLLLENVPQIHSKANMPHFQKWLDFLDGLGYSSFWQDLQAKDYGVAQSRNRTFVVSILGDYTYTFPTPIPLEKCMKDYLEDDVEEKYYIKTDKAKELINKLIQNGKIITNERTTVDLTVNEPGTIEVANCLSAHLSKNGNQISNRKQSENGVCEYTRVY